MDGTEGLDPGAVIDHPSALRYWVMLVRDGVMYVLGPAYQKTPGPIRPDEPRARFELWQADDPGCVAVAGFEDRERALDVAEAVRRGEILELRDYTVPASPVRSGTYPMIKTTTELRDEQARLDRAASQTPWQQRTQRNLQGPREFGPNSRWARWER